MIFDQLLVTTDFSEHSRVAFDIATYQAKLCNAKITLLNVSEPFEIPSILTRHLSDPEHLKSLRTDYEAAINEELAKLAAESFHRMEVNPVVVFSEKSPATVIGDFATENGFGLIVISSHGRGALSSLLMGSIAQRVIHSAECPVMVCPAR